MCPTVWHCGPRASRQLVYQRSSDALPRTGLDDFDPMLIGMKVHRTHAVVPNAHLTNLTSVITKAHAGVSKPLECGFKIGSRERAYDADTLEVTGSGNAVVGAYLNQLGLSIQAIAWLTSAQPQEDHPRWVAAEDVPSEWLEKWH
jgi:hypothetical protein